MEPQNPGIRGVSSSATLPTTRLNLAGWIFVGGYALAAWALLRLVPDGHELLSRFMDVFLLGIAIAAFRFSWVHGLALFLLSIPQGAGYLHSEVRWNDTQELFRLASYSVVTSILLLVIQRLQRGRENYRSLAERLRASEERFRELFQEAPVAYHEIDREGFIRKVNRAECELLGCEESEVLGKHVSEFLISDGQSSSEKLLGQKFTGSPGAAPQIRKCRHRSGSILTVEAHENLIVDEIGTIAGIRSALLDLSERERLELQLQQAQKLEAIGRLAGGVAHDFNNLLTVILGYGRLLEDHLGHHKSLNGSVQHLLQAGDRAAALTRQLLAFSRRQMLQPEVLNLNTVVLEMDAMLRRLIGEDIQLTTVLDPALGRVKADPGQVEQVVMNLAVNARDAMPEGGRLQLETANVELDAVSAHRQGGLQPGPYVALTVIDTGCGMDKQLQLRIFEPFFTTKERGKGTGLGLSTSYGIIKQSGGHISVSSVPGRGTTFQVYLPRLEEIEKRHIIPEAAEMTSHGSETILVVEDDPAVLQLTKEILTLHGYMVLTAEDPGEALRIVGGEEGPIHLLITDVILPGLRGTRLSGQAAALKPGMLIAYMSGYSEAVAADLDLTESGVAFIQKPFTPDSLARRVRELLDGPGGGRSVLVVDDDSEVRNFLSQLLSGAGYQVREAGTTEDAVRMLEAEPADLLIVDVLRIDHAGSAIRGIRRDRKRVKILATSAGFDELQIELVQAVGADATMAKPLQPDQLLAAVRKLLAAPTPMARHQGG